MKSRTVEHIPPHVMTALSNLGSEITAARKNRKLSAQALAAQTNISRPTLKRVENGEPGVTFGIYATVLDALDITDQLASAFTSTTPEQKQKPSRTEYRSLVWANPQADDSTFIRAALQKPKIVVLADIARDYGFTRLEREWNSLKKTPLGRKSAEDVNRMLGHLRLNYAGK